MDPDVVRRLRSQLGETEAELLVSVLATLAERVHSILGATLAGVYLKGSFALGSGDTHADVDFLVATHRGLDAEQEGAVRDLHRMLPDQEEHWAHVLEGSYASLDDLRARADPDTPWLYVDNGNRDMEWSTHDNTEVFRWILHNRALCICGPASATLIDEVPPLVLRHEAASLAVRRAEDIAADMDYLRNAWGQPHEVLTRCRLLYTATNAGVIGKLDAARWAKGVVPDEWHDLIDHAIADRPHPDGASPPTGRSGACRTHVGVHHLHGPAHRSSGLRRRAPSPGLTRHRPERRTSTPMPRTGCVRPPAAGRRRNRTHPMCGHRCRADSAHVELRHGAVQPPEHGGR